MSALSPSRSDPVLDRRERRRAPVFLCGRWWTVLSAGWLHAGLLHVAMNTYWVWQMGPVMADMLGPARTVIIYTVGGVTGLRAELAWGPAPGASYSLHGADVTVGASALVFGLIGALYHYGRTSSSIAKAAGTVHHRQAGDVRYPQWANSASTTTRTSADLLRWPLHLRVPQPAHARARRPASIIAVGCLAASALSIAASILTGHE